MEPLKHRYNQAYITKLAGVLAGIDVAFPKEQFCAEVMAEPWEELELKQRMRRITTTLRETLPQNYKTTIAILNKAAASFDGFLAMFFPEYVELYGQKDWETSLPALAWMTRFSSSEFAVRPFIKQDPTRMMGQMEQWATDENYHVRRLASEGCRPRLPWAMALPQFKQDPAPILPILELLKADPEEYVRRSVANNLNDISKDHPDLALNIAKRWLGHNPETDGLVKHACRTLLKAGRPEAMQLFGYGAPGNVSVDHAICHFAKIKIGGEQIFSCDITVPEPMKLRLEYAVNYVKANGSTSRKVFKISETQYKKGATQITRKQKFADLSTRKHYAGKHKIEVLINGVAKAEVAFELV